MATLQDYIYVQTGIPFTNICSVSVFAVNLAYYLVFSGLVVFTTYLLAKAIFNITQSDSSETFEKLKENVTGIVLSVIGLLVISSALFFPNLILRTMGVSDGNNPFLNFGGCSSEDFISNPVEVGEFTYEPPNVGGPTPPLPPEAPTPTIQPTVDPLPPEIPEPTTQPIDNPQPPQIPEPPTQPVLEKSSQMVCSGNTQTANQYNIGSFNIGGAVSGVPQLYKSESIINMLNQISAGGQGLDVITLQEVTPDLAAKLQADLAIKYGTSVYTTYKKHDNTGRNYGNMIISKYPISDVKTFPLIDSDGYVNRTLLSGVITTPTGSVRVFDLHTNAYNATCSMIEQTYGYMKPYVDAGEKVIVAGDFNEKSYIIFGEKYNPSCASLASKIPKYFHYTCETGKCQQQSQDPETVDHILGSNNGVILKEKCSKGNVDGLSDSHSMVGATFSL